MRAREHPAIVARGDSPSANPRLLKIMPGFNIRDMVSQRTKDHIASLKELIRGVGVQTPLEVRLVGEDLFVTHGHCRLVAVLELIAEGEEIATVPVTFEPKGINDAERDIRQHRSNTGLTHDVLENANLVRRLRGYGFEIQQIAVRCGWSVQTVNNLIEALELPAGTQQEVRKGEISATLAVKITRDEGEKAPEIIKAAKEEAKKIGKKKVTLKSVKRVPTSKASTAARGKEDALLDFAAAADKAQSYAQMDGGTPNPEHAQEIVTALGAALKKAKGKGVKPPEQNPAPIPGGMNGHAHDVKFLITALKPFAEYCETTQLTEGDRGDIINIRAEYVFEAAAAYRAATGGENVEA